MRSAHRVRGVSILAMYLYYIIYMRWVLLSYYQNVDRSPWVLPVLSYYQVLHVACEKKLEHTMPSWTVKRGPAKTPIYYRHT